MTDVAKEWRCFHCDEVFTDEAAAKLHFGTAEEYQPGHDDPPTPACLLTRDELEQVRRHEPEVRKLFGENARLEEEVDHLRDVQSQCKCHELRNALDSKEGERLVELARAQMAEAIVEAALRAFADLWGDAEDCEECAALEDVPCQVHRGRGPSDVLWRLTFGPNAPEDTAWDGKVWALEHPDEARAELARLAAQ
jgi:hypothetical protein